MANTKSAQKQVRASEKKRTVNKSRKTLSRTNVRKAEELIFAGELEAAKGAVGIAVLLVAAVLVDSKPPTPAPPSSQVAATPSGR